MLRKSPTARTERVLRRAAALVRRGWTQKCFARDARSEAVSINDPAAVRWCALGAINRTARELDSCDVYGRAKAQLEQALGVGVENDRSVVDWNDNLPRSARSQELVASTLKQAADRAYV